jgi:arylsulfatase A-like enzyme
MNTPHNPIPKSLILVTVDCLRADHVGFMGYQKPTTPFLDSLAKESYVLRSAMTTGAPTYFSLPSILASRYPLSLGRDVLGIAPGEKTIASVFRDHGYATACFSAANPYVSSLFGYQQGFDVFEDFLTQDDPARWEAISSPGWKGKLNRHVAEASRQLGPLSAVYDELYFQYCQRLAGPFFLWLHLMDPHAPYYPADQAMAWSETTTITPPQARYLNSYWNRSDLPTARLEGKKKAVVELYDAGISWVDAQLSRLVQNLTSTQRWHDCVFAVTVDHGEEFLDHGRRYHPPHRLHEELIHVPLLVRVPGSARGMAYGTFSLLHLAPTLLDAIGIAVPDEFSGKSHWRDLSSATEWHEPCVAEAVRGCTNPFERANRMHPRTMAVREDRYKLHLQFDTGLIELFDLESDPGEKSPIKELAVQRRLIEVARDHLERSVNQRDTLLSLRSKLREVQLQWPQSLVKPEYAIH